MIKSPYLKYHTLGIIRVANHEEAMQVVHFSKKAEGCGYDVPIAPERKTLCVGGWAVGRRQISTPLA